MINILFLLIKLAFAYQTLKFVANVVLTISLLIVCFICDILRIFLIYLLVYQIVLARNMTLISTYDL